VEEVLAHGQREARYVPRIEDLPEALDELTVPGDLLITFGAGSITNVGPQFLAL
jgi:UDP-N-acetylmuramate--alanine ligase